LTSVRNQITLILMDNAVSYFSSAALVLVIILLVWSLILTYQQKSRKVTARSRLAELKKKVEALPESTDEEKDRKSLMHRELYLEYLDNILGEIEKVQAGIAQKSQSDKKSKKGKKGK
jgi:hypothetical protein